MAQATVPGFADPGVLPWLLAADPDALDQAAFGIIGFDADADARVRRYNRTESAGSGMSHADVLAQPLFSVVAQCLNNYLVAQQFEDAQAQGTALDHTLPYVLTLRMRPTPVRLRLLSAPGGALRFVLIDRR